jgi:hypothetical protein
MTQPDEPGQPGKRWVILTFFEHAVERTLAEIEELKAGGLFVRGASGPGDTQQPAAAEQKPDGAPGPVLIPEGAPRPAAQPPAKAADKPAV